MRILFAGIDDHANIANRNARALRAAGIDARVYTARQHPFGYSEDLVGRPAKLAEWIKQGPVDWLVSTDEVVSHHDLVASMVPDAKLARMHVGSVYRADPEKHNAIDVDLGAKIRLVGPDLLRFRDGKIPTTEHLVAIESWSAVPWIARPIEVLHCPSKRRTKGTERILSELDNSPINVTVLEGMSHAATLEAMSNARVYIDQMHPEIGGFGVAAIEAAALGCSVVSDMRHVPEMGRPPFEMMTEGTVYDAVTRARGKGPASCMDWAMRRASPGVVARVWIELLGGYR